MRSFRRGRRKVPSSPPCTGTTSSRRRRELMHWFRRSPIRCRGNPRQNTSARVARFESARYGFAVLADYWAIAPASGGCVREDGGVLSYADREAGQLRFASFTADRPTGPLPRGRAGRRLAQLGCGSARRQFFRATSPFCGRRGAPRQGGRGQGGDRVFLLRGRRQANRGRRRGRLRHCRLDRPGPASWHELRIMPLRDPGDH